MFPCHCFAHGKVGRSPFASGGWPMLVGSMFVASYSPIRYASWECAWLRNMLGREANQARQFCKQAFQQWTTTRAEEIAEQAEEGNSVSLW